ncbi:BACON domain-containing protein [Arenibacter sp. 6A1]|uniref:BACON domain-containing protein n=1 Tax=Arenibacter sp. 6A1 TaxID=2720391 RepID=UPI00144681E5|nr:BACON domain-containing protein [Arenibacter sp. 6A1]NKI28275.1 BACON domain-containing protein [Arenibacter sp. 6A1]
MAITPNTVNLTYKKGTTDYLSEYVSYIEPGERPNEVARFLDWDNQPSWLNIYRPAPEQAKLQVASTAKNLSAGQYSAVVTLKMTIYENTENGEKFTYHTLGQVTINLTVEHTVELTAAPSNISHNYTLGGAVPSPTVVSVTSESAWTAVKTKTWVTLSNASGSGNGQFTVSVEASGLAVGTHADTITVTDNLFTKTVNVNLTVSEADTGTTYLYVNPSSIDMEYTLEGYLPIKNVEYNASGNWSAVADKTWVSLSLASGTAGVGNIELSLQNTETLTPGTHIAQVTFSQDGLVKNVFVTLEVYDLVQELLDPETLYFTEDENNIALSSKRENTFLSLSLASNFNGNVYTGEFAVPFYQGSGRRRIGQFPSKIISQQNLPGNFNDVSLYIPYLPAEINMTITEEDIVSDQVFQVVNSNGIKFIKGNKPATNWLSDMPLNRHLTKNGILTFGFLANGQSPTKIEVTGDKEISYLQSSPNNPFYAATLPLAKITSLMTGQSLKVSVLDIAANIEIVPEGIDHCMVFWENQWGIWDAFECKGEIIENDSYRAETFDFRKNHNTQETRVLKNTTTADYKIDTGWVYSPEEITGLSKMLGATNIYLQLHGEFIKVVPTTRKLQRSRTNDNEPSFSLTFDNATV